MTRQTQGIPKCIGLDYFIDPSKAGLSIYSMVCLANSNNMGLLAVMGGPSLVDYVE